MGNGGTAGDTANAPAVTAAVTITTGCAAGACGSAAVAAGRTDAATALSCSAGPAGQHDRQLHTRFQQRPVDAAAELFHAQRPGHADQKISVETVTREGVSETPLPPASGQAEDASNPFFTFHEAACILCGRCVTACQSLQHISAIGLAGRGRATMVTPGAGDSFRASVCTSCGSCVAACPTTALRPKAGNQQ